MPTSRKTFVFNGPPTRVDRLVAAQFKGISRAYIQSLIERGVVNVNGRTVEKGVLVKSKDRVQIESFVLPSERMISPNGKIQVRILYESSNLIVMDKPPGLPTHPNDFEDQMTLANFLIARFPELYDVGEDPLRPGIVHRLDTNTSGLILAARSHDAFLAIRKLFDERKMKKTYSALVLGKIERKGTIELPLAHHPKNPRKMIAVGKGKTSKSKAREAKTLYSPIQWFDGYTLLEVKTLTGRMHQVRAHLSAIGHPLVGDSLYQSAKERTRDLLRLDRHFLHAIRLEIPEFLDEPAHHFESALSSDLERCLTELRPIPARRHRLPLE